MRFADVVFPRKPRAVAFAVAAAAVTLAASACGHKDPAPPPPAPGALADARRYTLYRLNQIRARHGAGALVLDEGLNHFAQAGSVSLARDHRPHGHFKDAADTVHCRTMGENQGDPGGWAPGPPRAQIDQMLDMMMQEGPGGGHYDNILDRRWARVGIGVVNPGGAMYFTNDFCSSP
jgi:uncharacterized protein YkwD